jgi:hypothetical protein
MKNHVMYLRIEKGRKNIEENRKRTLLVLIGKKVCVIKVYIHKKEMNEKKPQEKVADLIFLVETRPSWKIQLIA